MGGRYEAADTVSEAEKAAERMGEVFKRSLLEFGAKVRDDEKAKTCLRLSLLATIEANVDNGKLDDACFREFVRNSLKAT